MYVVLAGGVGAARFLRGLVQVVQPERLTVIVNTGDDCRVWGLHVSPDIDINLYTLAGSVHPEQGWGMAGDTYHCLDAMGRYGFPTWFRLGDRDLATHIFRTQRMREGASLSAATAELARRWDVRLHMLPMSDDPVATQIQTDSGEVHFQEYLVQRGAQDPVLGVRYAGIEAARPAPGVLEAIRSARAVILPPSNPIVSVGTILAVPGVREALAASAAPCVAVSPIIAGRTVKGPADRLLQALGYDVSPLGVAMAYRGLLHGMAIDDADAEHAAALAGQGLRVSVTNTLMSTADAAAGLARETLRLATESGGSRQ